MEWDLLICSRVGVLFGACVCRLITIMNDLKQLAAATTPTIVRTNDHVLEEVFVHVHVLL